MSSKGELLAEILHDIKTGRLTLGDDNPANFGAQVAAEMEARMPTKPPGPADFDPPVEVGPQMTGNPKPPWRSCYDVSSWIAAELRRIPREIENIPRWQTRRRRLAQRKYEQFGVALDVIHYYVYPEEGP